MNREDNRLEKNEAFDWKAEIISWIKIIAAAAVIAFVLNNFMDKIMDRKEGLYEQGR